MKYRATHRLLRAYLDQQLLLIWRKDTHTQEKFADLVRIKVINLQSRMRNLHIVATGKEPRGAKPPCSLCQIFDNGEVVIAGEFCNRGVDDRRKIAKEKQQCFRCLATDHWGRNCPMARKCEIDGCSRNHHRLLHGGEVLSKTGSMTTLPYLNAQMFHGRWRPLWPWPAERNADWFLFITNRPCVDEGQWKKSKKKEKLTPF